MRGAKLPAADGSANSMNRQIPHQEDGESWSKQKPVHFPSYELEEPIWDNKSTTPSFSRPNQPQTYEIHPEGVSTDDEHGESWYENAAEFFDPTGILSYNDVARAYKDYKRDPSWGSFGNLALEGVGALPVVGAVKKWYGVGKGLGNIYNSVASDLTQMYGRSLPAIKGLNKYDALDDMYDDNNPFND